MPGFFLNSPSGDDVRSGRLGWQGFAHCFIQAYVGLNEGRDTMQWLSDHVRG